MSDTTLLDTIDMRTLFAGLDYGELFEGTSLEGNVEDSDNLGEVLGAEVGALIGRRVGAALGASAFESLLEDGEGEHDETESDGAADSGGGAEQGDGGDSEQAEQGTDAQPDEQDGEAEREMDEAGSEEGEASDIDSVEQLREMSYDDLQDVAKVVGVKANISQDEMVDRIVEEMSLEGGKAD